MHYSSFHSSPPSFCICNTLATTFFCKYVSNTISNLLGGPHPSLQVSCKLLRYPWVFNNEEETQLLPWWWLPRGTDGTTYIFYCLIRFCYHSSRTWFRVTTSDYSQYVYHKVIIIHKYTFHFFWISKHFTDIKFFIWQLIICLRPQNFAYLSKLQKVKS